MDRVDAVLGVACGPAASRRGTGTRHLPARPSSVDSAEPRSKAESTDDEPCPGGWRVPVPDVTPLVRKLAAENGVDLSTVSGSGVGGRIRKQDVLAAAEKAASRKQEQDKQKQAAPAADRARARDGVVAGSPPTAAHPGEGRPRAGQPGQVAAAASGDRSADDRVAAGVGPADHRAGGLRHPHRPAACAGQGRVRAPRGRQAHLTCRSSRRRPSRRSGSTPQLNASIDEESKEVTYHGAVHLAIAVDTPRGLLVPVISNAGRAEHRRPRPAHRRPRRAHPRQQGRPGRAVRDTFTITNIWQLGRPVRQPDYEPAQVGDPRHRRHHRGTNSSRARRRRRHLDPVGLRPAADLRRPARRRR